MDLLKEQRKLDRYSSWTRTKEEIRDDPRYQAIESSSTKEDYFREYCAKLSKVRGVFYILEWFLNNYKCLFLIIPKSILLFHGSNYIKLSLNFCSLHRPAIEVEIGGMAQEEAVRHKVKQANGRILKNDKRNSVSKHLWDNAKKR